jgi:hypothetical protein
MTKKHQRPVRKKTRRAEGPKVSEAEAVDVLRKHAERLRKLGAHAISIKPDAQGHVIEVYVPEDFRGTLPSKVATTVKGKKLDVRIKAKKAARFKPEKL